MKVSEFLKNGSENAVSGAVLAERLGVDGRTMRHMIKQERDSGTIILSGISGYFLPSVEKEKGHEEILSCYRQQKSRVFGSFPFLRVLENRLEIMPDQIEIEYGKER